MRWILAVGVVLSALGADWQSAWADEALELDLAHALHMREGRPHLELIIDGRRVISPDAGPLVTETACDVKVRAESIEEGVLLHFTIVNNSEESAALPVIRIPGVELPRQGIEILDNWKNVRFRKPSPTGTRYMLHAMRSYPNNVYSPVMGMRGENLFLGSAMLYEVFSVRFEVNPDYRFDRRSGTWSMEYRLWDQLPPTEDGRRVRPPIGSLAPGASIELSLAVTVAKPSSWVTAFRPYRDFFQKTYGSVRYARSGEPIFALSLGHGGHLADDNPKGYNSSGAGGYDRMDRVGWTGFYRRSREGFRAMGYQRIMLWQVAGTYREHRNTNMVWEITSSWAPIMNETAEELKRVIAEGSEVGFWWGRAFSVSGGFDSGVREPWDPDNPEHNEAAFRELDRAYELGVRLIGLDASPRSIFPRGWSPSSDITFQRILPMLHERYPEMRWIIEPAACDFLHLWGSSFMWSSEVHGPFVFADYIAPGHESHAVMRRGVPHAGQESRFAHMNQEALDQFMEWGYTPIVFDAVRFDLRIDRDLLDD